MDNKQLSRALQSIGKGCFVKYFEEFKNPTLSNEDIIELLVRQEKYAETASSTKVVCSRSIIHAGRAADALLEITQSKKLSLNIINKARNLLQKYYPNHVG